MKMKSWREELVEARTRQAQGVLPFSPRVMERASSWVTCAVGEQRLRHPGLIPYHWIASSIFSDRALVPNDATLFELGGMLTTRLGSGFCRAVFDQDVAAAERALDAIEDHVLVLKRQEGS